MSRIADEVGVADLSMKPNKSSLTARPPFFFSYLAYKSRKLCRPKISLSIYIIYEINISVEYDLFFYVS